MVEVGRQRLRATFNEGAELYDRCRPGYPTQLFADLATLVPITPGCRVLEIGCGTGQATLPLAQLGCTITAVELGTDLAAVARHKLARFATVRIAVTAFEDWPLPPDKFDLAVAATSFHWIDPTTRMTKAGDTLRPDGVLAVISTHHIAGGSNAFFTDVQRCYERFDPATAPGLTLPTASDVPRDSTEFDQSGRFGPVQFHRYQWDHTYTTSQYLDLLSTYSGHRAMPPDTRQALFTCISRLIDHDHNGTITKQYLTQLALAHRA